MESKRSLWPWAVVGVLAVTIAVNIVFGFVAITDPSGGFEFVEDYQDDGSYRFKARIED